MPARLGAVSPPAETFGSVLDFRLNSKNLGSTLFITHQDPGMNPPAEAAMSFFHQIRSCESVLVFIENILPAISARHHMVNRTSRLVSQWSRHAFLLAALKSAVNVCYLGLTPKQEFSSKKPVLLN